MTYPTELMAYRTVEEAVAGRPEVASRVMRSQAIEVARAAVDSGLWVAIDVFYRGRFERRIVPDHAAVPVENVLHVLTCGVCGKPVRTWEGGRFPVHAVAS